MTTFRAVIKWLAILILGVLLLPALLALGTLSAVNTTAAEPNYYLDLFEKHKLLTFFKGEIVESLGKMGDQNPLGRSTVEKAVSAALTEDWLLTQARQVVGQGKLALRSTGPAQVTVSLKDLKDRLLAELNKSAPAWALANVRAELNRAVPDVLDVAKAANLDAKRWEEARRIWRYRTMAVPAAAASVALLAVLVWAVSGATRSSTAPLGVIGALAGSVLVGVAKIGEPRLLAQLNQMLPQAGQPVGPGLPVWPLTAAAQDALVRDMVGGVAGGVTLAGAIMLVVGLLLICLPAWLKRLRAPGEAPPA